MVIHEAHLAGRSTSLEVGTVSRRGEGANFPWEATARVESHRPASVLRCSRGELLPPPLLVWVALRRGGAGAGGSLNRGVFGFL